MIKYCSVANSFKSNSLTIFYKSYPCHETCRPVISIFKIMQKKLHIAECIMTLGRGIPRGMHARSATQCIYLKPRIIRKTVHTIFFSHISCLHECVFAYCIGRFRYLLIAVYIPEGIYVEFISRNIPDFLKFMRIIGYEYKLLQFFCHVSIT